MNEYMVYIKEQEYQIIIIADSFSINDDSIVFYTNKINSAYFSKDIVAFVSGLRKA